jgi:Tol biopolymer transport system component
VSSHWARGRTAVVVIAISATVAAVLTATGGPAAAVVAGPAPRLASVDGNGVEGDGGSGWNGTALSADGRFVAFVSDATNLVPGDLNLRRDAFVKDRATGQTQRVSLSTGGAEANGQTAALAISADGRYVAFSSDATNLVPGDVNGVRDVFVRDRVTSTTVRVSTSNRGMEADGASDEPAISANGVYVAFTSTATNLVPADGNARRDVFVKAVAGAAIESVSVTSAGLAGNGHSFAPAISGNGKYVAFASGASDLVVNDLNGVADVFVRDRSARTTERVSLSSAGLEGNGSSNTPVMSTDGKYVGFTSRANNLVANDTNARDDVFVRDRGSALTTRASVSSTGAQGNQPSTEPAMSADGRAIAFTSASPNLATPSSSRAQIYVRHLAAGVTERVSVRADGEFGDHPSGAPGLSADGKVVAYRSDSLNLVPNTQRPHVYVRGAGLGPDPNCDFAESALVCELLYDDAVGPVSIRWYTGNHVHVPALDDQYSVVHPCAPGFDFRVIVEVIDANGPVDAEVTLPCLTDN